MSTEGPIGTKEQSGGTAGKETTQQGMEMFMSPPNSSTSHSFVTTAIETESELIKRALELPEILEEILRKLDKKNICNCRSVSKTWNNEARGILKNEVRLWQLENLEMLQDFCDTIQSSVDGISLTFQHLNFCGDTIPSITMEHPLNSVKQHVTRLEWNAVDQMGSADEMLQLIYNQFPNLKKLHIELSGTTKAMEALSSDFEVKMIPYCGKPLLQLEDMLFAARDAQLGRYLKRVNCFFKTLIGSAVNLKYLSLQSLHSWNTEERARIEENIISSITSCNIQKIVMEDFWTSMENVEALSNHHLGFPLTNLRLEKIDLHRVDLEPLLKRCSPYLLELYLVFTESHAFVNFPFGIHLKKLWSLTLIHAKEKFYIDWNRMPQLRKLVLYECSLKGIVTSLTSSPNHCTHLETLDILPYYYCEGQLFPLLLNQMLTHLNSRLTSLCLHVWWIYVPPLALIFKECTSLQYFSLRFKNHDLTDQGLCGVEDPNGLTVTWPDNIREEKEYSEDLDDEAILDFPYHRLVNQVKNPAGAPHRPFPYIGNLKELQILVLYGHFTELALLHGIVHCRNLTRMVLYSPLICRKRAARIIRNADLAHLKSVKIKGQFISHLPEESPSKVPTRNVSTQTTDTAQSEHFLL